MRAEDTRAQVGVTHGALHLPLQVHDLQVRTVALWARLTKGPGYLLRECRRHELFESKTNRHLKSVRHLLADTVNFAKSIRHKWSRAMGWHLKSVWHVMTVTLIVTRSIRRMWSHARAST